MTISYSSASWNPLVGCFPHSPGCQFCWAAREAGTRLAHLPAYQGISRKVQTLVSRLGNFAAEDDPKGGYTFTGEVRLIEERLDEPLRKQKRQRYFVCSTSDMFYEKVPDEWRDRMLAVMLLSPWHTYLICTKRPQAAYKYLQGATLYKRVLKAADAIRSERPGLTSVGVSDPKAMSAPWIWWGISAENKNTFNERMPWLRKLPVAKRWISFAPLLEEIPLEGELQGWGSESQDTGNLAQIDWACVEGESGPNARRCDLAWIRYTLASCDEQSVPAYLKQLGENTTDITHFGEPLRIHIGRRGDAARDPLCWPADLRGRRELPDFWRPPWAEQLHFPSLTRKRKAKT